MENPINFKCDQCGHFQERDDEHWWIYKRDSGEPDYYEIYECRLCGDDYYLDNSIDVLGTHGCRGNGYGSEKSHWTKITA